MTEPDTRTPVNSPQGGVVAPSAMTLRHTDSPNHQTDSKEDHRD
ncbi:hypothetical protein [Pseudonocardia spinosispora]|nr:hypothetical protein [Pseudonocardia spinosispora]